ncbi:hypothetical protein CFE53_03895 [Methanofervidicoccus sp. A16]|uniref:HEAT repeat domain-containing protein n=1 Tax=Methanofervidicoccus sp. A16 TaxID=2607662 RepID=UPI00118A8516|nr:hypothetical protein [Methanofervidicoccus sp. A16]AXI25328.1 hypothetical protein CFE53_03895 [Methanofervidicoccus sp. A16]
MVKRISKTSELYDDNLISVDSHNLKDLLKTFKKGDVKTKLSILNKISLISVADPKALQDVIPYLIELIEDKDWKIRKNTVEILGNIGLVSYEMVENYLDKILKKLDDKNLDVVYSTAYAVVKISINPKCKNKHRLINKVLKKIRPKSNHLYSEIIKNISEIYPHIAQKYIKNTLKLLNEDSPIIKINILKTLGNVGDIKIDREVAQEIVKYLRGPPELKRYSAYAIWKLSKKNLKHFDNAIEPLIEIANVEKDEKLIIYSILALNALCHINPKKFKKLNINSLIYNKHLRKPLLELLYNLSTLDYTLLAPYIDILHDILNTEEDVYTNKMIIRIIGNMGLYDRRYIDKYIPILQKKLKIRKLKQDVVLTLVKGNYIDKNVLRTILHGFRNLDNEENMKFLEEIIAHYPLNLLDALYNEIKKLEPYLNRNNNFKKLLNIIKERLEEKDKISTEDINTVIEEEAEKNIPKIVVALESECAKVELEDGKKVYIIPENTCVKTPLSNELLKVLEKYSKNEMEMYKLVHEIMVKSLIEDVLLDYSMDQNDRKQG